MSDKTSCGLRLFHTSGGTGVFVDEGTLGVRLRVAKRGAFPNDTLAKDHLTFWTNGRPHFLD